MAVYFFPNLKAPAKSLDSYLACPQEQAEGDKHQEPEKNNISRRATPPSNTAPQVRPNLSSEQFDEKDHANITEECRPKERVGRGRFHFLHSPKTPHMK